MALRILSNDIVNPEIVALVVPGAHSSEKSFTTLRDASHTGVRGVAGSLQLNSFTVPGIAAIDLRWKTHDADVCMTDEIPSKNININFQMRGKVQSRFSGLGHGLDMLTGRHNLVYAPEPGDETRVARNMEVEMMHISIDRDHFKELIGCDNPWAERALRELDAERPFSGIYGTGAVTPAMQQLIYGIRAPQVAAGPMQRLLVHARILELLSLQFGQFLAGMGTAGRAQAVTPADVERLRQLKDYLDTHFLAEDISLTQLGRRFLLNDFKLKRGFKEIFGTTVFGYLKELRMNYAAALLRDDRKMVEEVAYTLGYEHAHHFAAAFKKHYGNSPGQWVKKSTAFPGG